MEINKSSSILSVLEENTREIHFNNSVNDLNVANLLDKVRQLHNKNPEQYITLYICSGGGNPYPAIGFYDYIRNNQIKLITIAIGMAASSATIIFLAGQKRKMGRHALLLIHDARRGVDNKAMLNTEEYSNLHLGLEKLQRIMDNIAITNSKVKKIRKLSKKDTPLTADEALNHGLIHEIIG